MIEKDSNFSEKKTGEILAFRCSSCGSILDLGSCGDHRNDTSHKEFDPIYKENISIFNDKRKSLIFRSMINIFSNPLTDMEYRQTTPYTCGPSCVMMLKRQMGDGIDFTVEKEREIWEETRTNNGSLVYTTHPRLASFLIKDNFQTTLWHLREGTFSYSREMNYGEFQKRMKYYNKHLNQALNEGMGQKIFDFSSKDLANEIREERKSAIIFTKLLGTNNIFHHIFAYGSSNEHIKYICPVRGAQEASMEEVDKFMLTPFGKSVLLVERRNNHHGKK